ncbi:MAG: hypothetical protein HN390_03945 [Anaerolineae bacterium]|nr:hypothetical protein [Anaerolineae bacterium]MBT7189509.1 hypothetical protein [Anaerolineae bacterium]MBT7989735.1 hypothetical protein [Anaerolineae bacterium]
MKKLITKQSTKGQGLVEYALIVALIIAGVLVSLEMTGYTLREAYCRAAQTLGSEQTCGEEEIYCEDDFASADNWTSQYGTWTNSEGQLCTSAGAKNFNNCSQSMSNNEDYSIKLDGAQLDRGNGYGVFFRGTDMGGRTEGYIVQYDPGWGGGSIIMRKWVNGRELPPFAIKRMPGYDWFGEPHDIQLDVEGDTFTFTLDGEEVLVGQDDTYTEGGVGLRSWDGTEVCFDNLSIGELSTNTGEE